MVRASSSSQNGAAPSPDGRLRVPSDTWEEAGVERLFGALTRIISKAVSWLVVLILEMRWDGTSGSHKNPDVY